MEPKRVSVLATIGVSIMMSISVARGDCMNKALGELKERAELTQQRMAQGDVPRFTRDFVLADVVLDPAYPRRFSEYSGDLSGRVIGAIALTPAQGNPIDLDSLVKDALTYQREDGRFGNPALEYTADAIVMEHMALLWGNGRMLVGLLEYHSVKPDPAVLEASRKLGDFLLAVRESCSSADVSERIKDFGAAGIICLTQLIEGLVMLSDATGDAKYLDAAEQIVPWLEPRGTQHSHGYLTTLRGMVMLYEATRKADILAKAEQAYAELVASPDYLVYGGVLEYFGGKGDNDEGCSEADFLRLSLQLWHATGKADYIERAERCLLNQFFANEFQTGDFGHRRAFQQGFMPPAGIARAWWCCTMHGLRALRDVVDSVVREEEGLLKVDMFLDAAFSAKEASGTVTRLSDGRLGASIALQTTSGKEFGLAVRKPAWAKATSLKVNGQAVDAEDTGPYAVVKRAWASGDVLEAAFETTLRLETRDKKTIAIDAMGADAVEAALFYGPYLLSAQSNLDDDFFTEPWTNNVVYLTNRMAPTAASGTNAPFTVPGTHFETQYLHGGFPDLSTVTLRPLSEYTQCDRNTVGVWLNYKRK